MISLEDCRNLERTLPALLQRVIAVSFVPFEGAWEHDGSRIEVCSIFTLWVSGIPLL